MDTDFYSYNPSSVLSTRQRYIKRWNSLKDERSQILEHHRELADYFNPYRARFQLTDRNKTRKNDKIINGTPRWSLRTLANGMMAGVISPARPWYRLLPHDLDLLEYGPAKMWLWNVENILRIMFARSNVYNGVHTLFKDLALFGTGALHIDEDPEDGMRGYVYPIGTYCIATDSKQRVDTVYRELSMTVVQLAERFGLKNCSEQVKRMYNEGSYDRWVDLLHVIQPNLDYVEGKAGPRGMKWKSCWMEQGRGDYEGFLKESGYNEFPTRVPRWDVTGEDAWGYSPAMDVLGDAKALQLLERRKAQLVDKTSMPPMVGPASMMHRRASLLPGEINYVDSTVSSKFEPAIQIQPQAIANVHELITRHEERIKQGMFADLWLMLAESDRREITAREVAERHEEKMLQLGPVMERLQDELLDPLIDRAFSIAWRQGLIPPPPPELAGMELKVEYISIVTQAQKMISVSGIEQLATFVGNMSAVIPSIKDNIDGDKTVALLADAMSVPPGVVKPPEQVAEERAESARQAQAQQAAEQANLNADSVAKLAKAQTGGQNALSDLTQTFTQAGGMA